MPRFEPGAVLAAIDRHRVTTVPVVPTMLQQLIDHPDVDDHDLSSVRAVFYGGSPITEAVLRRAMTAFPKAGAPIWAEGAHSPIATPASSSTSTGVSRVS